MSELRSAKLLSATLLICVGAVCVTIGGLPTDGDVRAYVGVLLLAFGIPLLVRQWTGRGLLTLLRTGAQSILHTPWLAREKSLVDETIEVEGRI